jgi:hypothetical protein
LECSTKHWNAAQSWLIVKSVKSSNPRRSGGQVCKSLPCRQAGVILTNYDIVKAHVGELKVESPPAGLSADKEGEGSEFIIQIPNTVDKTARP